jgi:hypothetical protein
MDHNKQRLFPQTEFIWFHNREKYLQRGTNWIFKYNSGAQFLDAFEILRKASISFVMTARMELGFH